jgi:hypothetical protein
MIRAVAARLKEGSAPPSTKRDRRTQNMWRAIYYRFHDAVLDHERKLREADEPQRVPSSTPRSSEPTSTEASGA